MSTECVIHCSGACAISGGVCYARPLPPLCNGALVFGSSCDPIPMDSAGVIYDNGAIYSIGRMRSILPGYNPSNTGLDAYQFTAEDLLYSWQPAIYHVSGGSVTMVGSGGVVSSGGVQQICANNYNTATDEYYIISWYEPAESLAGGEN